MREVIELSQTPCHAQLTARADAMFRRVPVRGPERAGLSELLQLMGCGDDGNTDAAVLIPLRRVKLDETLFHQGADAESFYFVRAGTFKIYRTIEDGYEQVLGFVGHAEVLGFDALYTGCHFTAALALEDSSVFVVPLRDFFALAKRVPALDLVVHRAVSRALTFRAELADVMAAVAAEVRLARFLMHLSGRMVVRGQSARRFRLRMNRRDIASYLGVAPETVSRSFGALANWGLARADNREVEILDIELLRTLSRSTRRQVDGNQFGALHERQNGAHHLTTSAASARSHALGT